MSGSFWYPVLGAIVGVILRTVYDRIRDAYRFKKELTDNNDIDVSGSDWYAAWQTSVDGKELLNTEQLHMTQKGQTVHVKNLERAPENPKGGYLWTAQMQFFQGRSLMGWYFANADENNGSRGIMYLSFFSPRRVFIGQWTGTSYDGDLVTGFVVISGNREASLDQLRKIIVSHPQDIAIVGNTI